jgi:hypothetical protein
MEWRKNYIVRSVSPGIKQPRIARHGGMANCGWNARSRYQPKKGDEVLRLPQKAVRQLASLCPRKQTGGRACHVLGNSSLWCLVKRDDARRSSLKQHLTQPLADKAASSRHQASLRDGHLVFPAAPAGTRRRLTSLMTVAMGLKNTHASPHHQASISHPRSPTLIEQAFTTQTRDRGEADVERPGKPYSPFERAFASRGPCRGGAFIPSSPGLHQWPARWRRRANGEWCRRRAREGMFGR